MDLTTIPPEILAVIMKHLAPADLVRLRKSSQLVDQVTKRFGINKRLPIKRLQLSFSKLKYKTSSISILIKKSLVNAYREHPLEHPKTKYSFEMDSLPQVLEKVRVTAEFHFGCSPYMQELDVSVIRRLEKEAASFRLCPTIRFFDTKFTCTRSEAKNFLNIFRNATKIVISQSIKSGIFLNSEALRTRKWHTISLMNSRFRPDPDLDDSFLYNMVRKGTALDIRGASANFSFEGVVSALQILSTERTGSGKSLWGVVQFGDIGLKDATEVLRKIPGIQVAVEGRTKGSPVFNFNITFLNNDRNVHFIVRDTNLQQ